MSYIYRAFIAFSLKINANHYIYFKNFYFYSKDIYYLLKLFLYITFNNIYESSNNSEKIDYKTFIKIGKS